MNAQVILPREHTDHENIAEQFDRLSANLWKEYAEKLDASEEIASGKVLQIILTHPDKDYVSPIQTLRNDLVHSTRDWTWSSVAVVLTSAVIERSSKFQSFAHCLDALRNVPLPVKPRTKSATSTFVSFHAANVQVGPHLKIRQFLDEPNWTDQKNRRRCELVDKEIEGRLSSAEQLELEELQKQMLAYRRSVAPLPLDELRELHQALLGKMDEESEKT